MTARSARYSESGSKSSALVLAHETGHRLSAIRALRWSDVDFKQACIRWRAEADKIDFEHETPLTEAALTILTAGAPQDTDRNTLLFPDPDSRDAPQSRYAFIDWWKWAERLAGLEPVPRRGWHSLRRKFATELKTAPLKDLCALGGWKAPATVLTCYIQPDEPTMRDALAQRKALRVRRPV